MTGEHFRQIRKAAEISQWELANLVGTSQSRISLHELSHYDLPDNIYEQAKIILAEIIERNKQI